MCYDCQQTEVDRLMSGDPPLNRAQALLFLQSRAKQEHPWAATEVMHLDSAEISALAEKLKPMPVIAWEWYDAPPAPKPATMTTKKPQSNSWLYNQMSTGAQGIYSTSYSNSTLGSYSLSDYETTYQQTPSGTTYQTYGGTPNTEVFNPAQKPATWSAPKQNGKDPTLLKHIIAYEKAVHAGEIWKQADPPKTFINDDLYGKVEFDGTAYGYYQTKTYLEMKKYPPGYSSYQPYQPKTGGWYDDDADPLADMQAWKKKMMAQAYVVFDPAAEVPPPAKIISPGGEFLNACAAKHQQNWKLEVMLAQHHVYKLTGHPDYAPTYQKLDYNAVLSPLTALDMPKNLAVSKAQAEALDLINQHIDYVTNDMYGYVGSQQTQMISKLQTHARVILKMESSPNGHDGYPHVS